MRAYSTRTRVLLSTGSMALSLAILPSAAQADCLPNVGNTIVTCQVLDTDGFDASALTNITVNVDPLATVNGTLKVGTPGTLNNEGLIDVFGGTAIDALGGVTINNAATGPGTIIGDITMGATTGTQVNTFNPDYSPRPC